MYLKYFIKRKPVMICKFEKWGNAHEYISIYVSSNLGKSGVINVVSSCKNLHARVKSSQLVKWPLNTLNIVIDL